MRQFRAGFLQLLYSWKPLLLFELFWKLFSFLLLAPACAGLIQLAIRAAQLRYLTNANLGKFLQSPWTILLLAGLLLTAALYTLFEIAAVCTCFRQPKNQRLRLTLRQMLRAGIESLRHFFRLGSPLLVLHLLLLIPLMQFSATSGIFTAMGIPDFLAYYMTKKEFLPPVYLGVIILCCLLCVRWIFAVPLFTQHPCRFRNARRHSQALTKGRFFSTFFSVLLWNLCYFAVLLLLLCLITGVVLLVIRGTDSGAVISSHAARLLKLLLQLVLWIFSCFATPVCMAHVTALLDIRCAQLPWLELPPEAPTTRRSRPFSRHAAVVTTVGFTAAALALHISYLYSLFRGQSTLQLTLYSEPTITAHRGFSAQAPENTLYAFSDAIEAGADWIELDVQQTKDGVLVVMHDDNLRRTTGLNRNIWEVDYAEIQSLDAGTWFDPMYANARIPTLEETLQFIDHRITLNIEIKPTRHTSDTLEQDVAALIEAYDYTADCWVTSFSYGALKRIKQANPDIRTGYIMSVAYGQFYSLQYADAFSLNKVFVTRQVVNSAHQAGKQVFAWTVNSSSEMRSLSNLQVDNIITDDPVLAQDVISRSNSSETLRTVLDYFIN